uniref:Putative LAGLIDADG homing endonuclease n=1 Tax=Rhexinema sarcinoideum TaxID=43261 RepID=A0A1B2RYT9_9CHLO|nr:putative LAGLIDADG homing endonuclease [Rhexinema sarcinoideum]
MCWKLTQPLALGSSETPREAPLHKAFNFDFYFEFFQPKHIKTKNSSFLEWFVGFSERDGSFIVFKKKCFFMINQKNIQLLYKIKKYLGFSQVICYTQNSQK